MGQCNRGVSLSMLLQELTLIGANGIRSLREGIDSCLRRIDSHDSGLKENVILGLQSRFSHCANRFRFPQRARVLFLTLVDRIDSGTPRIDSYPSRDEISLPILQGIDSEPSGIDSGLKYFKNCGRRHRSDVYVSRSDRGGLRANVPTYDNSGLSDVVHDVGGLRTNVPVLLTLGDIVMQGIVDVPTQSQNSVTHELAGGSMTIESVETVLNLNEEKHYWILREVVLIECGAKGWYYASCRNCYKKVDDKKDLYKCANCGQLGSKPPLKYKHNVIITDGTGCITILLWNSEATLLLGKIARDVKDANPELDASTYPKMFDAILEKRYLVKIAVERKNISNVDPVYSVIRVSEDPSFIELYSSQRSTVSVTNMSVSNGLDPFGLGHAHCDVGGPAVISLSKDSATESTCGDGLGTPSKEKSIGIEEVDAVGINPSPADAQLSTNKTFHRGSNKRKLE
ncbi:hypothetical protein PIB30_091924 [Stylosanthes scabra]|uniref:Replication factor A C-terminal domain-containing protein n=1 Tax=Stylosanthes scabra TaxID=79078 RepID=A0ABU6RVM9_9FABA|nr:hypothetical protein [Stylosanthes scabra]